jgi:hypothetical protein
MDATALQHHSKVATRVESSVSCRPGAATTTAEPGPIDHPSGLAVLERDDTAYSGWVALGQVHALADLSELSEVALELFELADAGSNLRATPLDQGGDPQSRATRRTPIRVRLIVGP